MTYVLLVAVACIWGIIIYQIVTRANANDGSDVYVAGVEEPMQKLGSSIQKDSFDLILNYKDPFGKRLKSNKPKVTTTSTGPRVRARPLPKPKEKEEKEEKIVWPEVRYQGLMQSRNSNTQTALLTLQGRSEIVHENDIVSGLTIERVYQDSIRLKFKDESKVFVK